MHISWKNCLKIGISLFVLYLCIYYVETAQNVITTVFSAAMPLIIGCVIAFFVNIVMKQYEAWYFPKGKHPFIIKSRRPVSMIAAYITLAAIVLIVVGLILPQLLSCMYVLIEKLPSAMQFLLNSIEKTGILPEDIVALLGTINWKDRIGDFIKVFTSGLGNVMDMVFSTVVSLFSGIVTTLISIIFSVYLLAYKDKLKTGIKKVIEKFLPEKVQQKLVYLYHVIFSCFHDYVVGQCIEALILGVLCTLGMTLLRLPYATMIGALVAFTALIPVAGAYIGALVGAFMIVTVSPMNALVFLIFLIILQQLEGNIIYPKVVGSSLGLPGLWVLAAVTIGGGVAGIVGILLSVPLAAIFYRLLKNSLKDKAQGPQEES